MSQTSKRKRECGATHCYGCLCDTCANIEAQKAVDAREREMKLREEKRLSALRKSLKVIKGGIST